MRMALFVLFSAAVLAIAAAAPAAAAREPTTVYDTLANMPEVSSVFAKMSEFPKLLKQFQNPRLAVTLFVPSNAAYDRIVKAVGNNPAIMSDAGLITQAMYYHILPKARKSRELPKGAGPLATSLPGASAVVTNDGAAFKYGGYDVTVRDVKAGKSIVNVIDGFAIAPSLVPVMLSVTRGQQPAAGRKLLEEAPATTAAAAAPAAPVTTAAAAPALTHAVAPSAPKAHHVQTTHRMPSKQPSAGHRDRAAAMLKPGTTTATQRPHTAAVHVKGSPRMGGVAMHKADANVQQNVH